MCHMVDDTQVLANLIAAKEGPQTFYLRTAELGVIDLVHASQVPLQCSERMEDGLSLL